MGHEIKQTGYVNGDKWMKGIIPNMKIGEIRYYPQDNPNLYRTMPRELSPKTLTRIFNSLFPEYEVEIDENDSTLIDHIVKRGTSQYIINRPIFVLKKLLLTMREQLLIYTTGIFWCSKKNLLVA